MFRNKISNWTRYIFIHAKSEAKFVNKFISDVRQAKGHQIKFFNFWEPLSIDNWFFKFIHSRNLLKDNPGTTISFFSVFGRKYAIDFNNSDIKIFFTGENVYRSLSGLYKYTDYCLSDVDLSLGFENIASDKYVRFPVWILFIFEPDSSDDEIRETCRGLSINKYSERKKFASHISSIDRTGLRAEMCNSIGKIERVDCAGRFMNNTDELYTLYNDNKINYLRNFKFNICPENSNRRGYVTEKLFQAFSAGCIPVYWGSDNEPEPGIINPEAVIFWKGDGSAIERIRELHYSDNLYREFFEQPRLISGADELIIDMFNSLENKLHRLIHEAAVK